MQDITDTSSCVTSNPAPEHAQHAVLPTLRPLGIPTEPLRVVAPLHPRPAPPTSAFNPNPDAIASWWQHAEAFANGETPGGAA